MGVREASGGGAWAALGRASSFQPVKACYTISPDTLPVGKAGVWGMGKGGRLKPVPLKGTSALHTYQAQRMPLGTSTTGEK